MRGTSPEKCALALTTPTHLYSWSTIKKDPGVIPNEGGLYGWYFDRYLRDVPKRGCHGISRRKLLYVGISPASERSAGTLRSRILYHFRGNCSGSTLRTTLAVLLQPQLRHRLRRPGGVHSIKLTTKGEKALSCWLSSHARVCWVLHDLPWEAEPEVIRSLYLPLNLAHNRDHPFHTTLSDLRRRAKNRARASQASAGLP